MKVTTLEEVLMAIDFARDILTISSNSSAEELQKQFLEKIASSGLNNCKFPARCTTKKSIKNNPVKLMITF